jgi:hypothetical protein
MTSSKRRLEFPPLSETTRIHFTEEVMIFDRSRPRKIIKIVSIGIFGFIALWLAIMGMSLIT